MSKSVEFKLEQFRGLYELLRAREDKLRPRFDSTVERLAFYYSGNSKQVATSGVLKQKPEPNVNNLEEVFGAEAIKNKAYKWIVEQDAYLAVRKTVELHEGLLDITPYSRALMAVRLVADIAFCKYLLDRNPSYRPRKITSKDRKEALEAAGVIVGHLQNGLGLKDRNHTNQLLGHLLSYQEEIKGQKKRSYSGGKPLPKQLMSIIAMGLIGAFPQTTVVACLHQLTPLLGLQISTKTLAVWVEQQIADGGALSEQIDDALRQQLSQAKLRARRNREREARNARRAEPV